jgi:hypothetical protein
VITISPSFSLYRYDQTSLVVDPPLNSFSLIGSYPLEMESGCTHYTWRSAPYSFTIVVTNSAPSFPGGLASSLGTMYINATLSVPLPTYSDPEGHAVSVTLVTPLSWVSLSGNDLVFSPSQYSQLGVTSIDIQLSDSYASATFTTSITIVNRPPDYDVAHTYGPVSVHLNALGSVPIPSF